MPIMTYLDIFSSSTRLHFKPSQYCLHGRLDEQQRSSQAQLSHARPSWAGRRWGNLDKTCSGHILQWTPLKVRASSVSMSKAPCGRLVGRRLAIIRKILVRVLHTINSHASLVTWDCPAVRKLCFLWTVNRVDFKIGKPSWLFIRGSNEFFLIGIFMCVSVNSNTASSSDSTDRGGWTKRRLYKSQSFWTFLLLRSPTKCFKLRHLYCRFHWLISGLSHQPPVK
jgi:hypothetical protein